MKDALHIEIKIILKKTALKKLKKKKTLQKSALAAIEKCIRPKSVNLNLILKKNLFWKTPSKRPPPPRSSSTKIRDKFHLFPQTLKIRQCCCRYTSPKLLYPQAVPSKIPAGLFGPHKPSVFYWRLADLVWLNRQKGQGSPNGKNRLQVSGIFLSLKQQEETN